MGKMSSYLHSLQGVFTWLWSIPIDIPYEPSNFLSFHINALFSKKVGDSLEIRGPVGRFKYAPNQCKHMGLIAGGTGLTPCLQVIRCVFEGKDFAEDKCKFTLYYQNR